MRSRLLVVAALISCKSSDAPAPPPDDAEPPVVLPAETCAPAHLDDPHVLPNCSLGSGALGRWTLGDDGLPAYDFQIDSPVWPTTDGVEHREAWHPIGNHRVTAIVSTDGWVSLFEQDRGPTWLNVFDADQKAYAGGFGWIDDGEQRWSTAYGFRRKPSKTRRLFGSTWAALDLEHREVKSERKVFAPAGDATALIAEVTLTNLGAAPKSLRHYEYWDVARRQLRTSWLASGVSTTTIPGNLARSRDGLNAYFDETPSWDAASKTLRVTRVPSAEGKTKLPSPDAVSDLDAKPGDPYLTMLTGEVAEAWTDQAAFFGDGDATLPDAVRDHAKGVLATPANGLGQPVAFVLASDVTLAPGEKKTLRFAYGYGTPDPAWRDDLDLRKKATDAIRPALVSFAADRDPWLSREAAWHSIELQTSVGWREYWGHHVVPQGSAYLYLHGADGAARDQALFSLPLTWSNPALAREQLQFLMSIQHPDGRFTYAFQGHGVLDDALIHTAPSDLDLFFLLAMTEYLEATGDASLIDAAGFDHVKKSARHLLDVVGTGPHGLIRVGTGDWSDGIVAANAKDRDLALKEGESVPNTQMAIWVLPRAASWIRSIDAALADELEAKVPALRDAAAKEWTTDHYRRAWLGGDQVLADLQLEAQVWGLIADLPDAAQRATLVSTIESKLHQGPTGPFMFQPPEDDPQKGDVWPAIADLLAWGYAKDHEDLAWKTLTDVTLKAHATAFPDLWAGIWSAADGTYGVHGGAAPGSSWSSVVTPMLDFPVMNANAHAMPLFALLRLCGLEPIAGGLRVAPKIPGRTFTLDVQLIRLEVKPSSIRGVYRPIADGARTIEVELGTPITKATLDSAPVTATGTKVRFDVTMTKGKEIAFSVEGA